MQNKDKGISDPAVRSDLEGLQALIDLPADPVSVRWQTQRQPGAADFSMTAVLRYSADVLDTIVARSNPFEVQPAVTVRAEILRALFPPSLQQNLDAGEIVPLRGLAVQPNLFANEKKSSLIHGRVLVMKDSGLVFVALFTM